MVATRVISRVEESPLVVFFPTVVSTNLGFLVQGPVSDDAESGQRARE